MRSKDKLFIIAALIAQAAVAQDPAAALSKLSPEARDWVNRSCSRSLGPSLWSSCVARATCQIQLQA